MKSGQVSFLSDTPGPRRVSARPILIQLPRKQTLSCCVPGACEARGTECLPYSIPV